MKAIFAMGAAITLAACATVTKGTEDTVRFESTPAGADVAFKETTGKLNVAGCVTPCEKELNRKYAYFIEISKTGYETFTQLLEPKLSGDGAAGMAGNILIGGIIGAAVDASTGAMNDLRPNPMVAVLVETETAVVAEDASDAEIVAEDAPSEIVAAAEAVVDVVEGAGESAVESVEDAAVEGAAS